MGAERDVAVGDSADGTALERAIAASTSGRFRLRRAVGVGGMGVVWEADDATLGERVALKTLQHVDGRALLRFKNEFRAVRDVIHPNLVRLGELFEASGTWFFTMELVAGSDLLAWFHGQDHAAVAESTLAQVRPARGSQPPGPRPPLDFAGVRAVFGQVAAALAALHDHQLIHRDVKPENVRVTPDGRAVLLDFGLIAESATEASIDGGLVGTASYMAPEQAAGGAVGPSADWYAFGVTLYEVLTGRVPFEGSMMQVLLDKQRVVPPPASRLAPDVPADLDALCSALMAFDPRLRPTAAEVLRHLGDAFPMAPPGTSSGGPLFVGRERELRVLREAFDEVVTGNAPITVLIHGESGIGKSALVAQFGGEAAAGEALVLRGRCYERESLPYKALDGVIDSLASALQRMSKADAAGAVPRHATLLMRLFPVLGRVDAFRKAPEARGGPSDPLEQRRQAFGALRELLARVAERRRLVLVVDDLQWSDPDGVELLRAVLEPPDPPALLVVLTSHGAEVKTSSGEWSTPLRTIALAPLDVREATQLARGLLGGGDDALAASLVRETHGHPLLLAELTRYSAAQGPGVRTAVSLEDAIAGTLLGLGPDARAVIELIATAAAPVSQRALGRAAHLTLGDVGRVIGSLRVARMVRTDRSLDLDLVECIHDRVRDAVFKRLSPAEARAHHAALAMALEADPGCDREAIARHYQAAGDITRAIGFWERAAAHAVETLAFGSASILYRRILEHDTGASPERRHALHRRLAEALVGAGRGKEASAAYVEAARGANVAGQIELQRLASGHLMRSGHIDEGLALLRRVLADVGLSMPMGGSAGLLFVLWNRLVIRVRGYGFVARDESQVPPSTLTLLDALGATSESTAWLEPIAGAGLHARYLRAALAAGEPRRVARALLGEVLYLSVNGASTERQADRALEAATRVIERLGDPELRAMRTGAVAIVEYQRGHFADALPAMARAIDEIRAASPGHYYELTILHVFRLYCLVWLGQYGDLAREYHAVARDADERGDLWAGCLARLGIAANAHLWGPPDRGARAILDAALAPWAAHRFGLPHFLHLHGTVDLALSEGRPADALATIEAAEKDVRGALLFQSQMLRVLHLRNVARALLAQNDGPHDARARACIQRLRREGVGYATAFAAYFAAVLVLRHGTRDDAQVALVDAERRLRGEKMLALAGGAAVVRGRVTGGAQGASVVVAAENELRALGIVNIDHAVRVSAFGPTAGDDEDVNAR